MQACAVLISRPPAKNHPDHLKGVDNIWDGLCRTQAQTWAQYYDGASELLQSEHGVFMVIAFSS